MTESNEDEAFAKLLRENAQKNQALKKSWLQKLLVIALCALSFYAGWQANHSSQVRNCLQSGGQVVEQAGIFGCQWQ